MGLLGRFPGILARIRPHRMPFKAVDLASPAVRSALRGLIQALTAWYPRYKYYVRIVPPFRATR